MKHDDEKQRKCSEKYIKQLLPEREFSAHTRKREN